MGMFDWAAGVLTRSQFMRVTPNDDGGMLLNEPNGWVIEQGREPVWWIGNDQWGGAMFVKDKERDNAAKLWVKLAIPSDPRLAGKTVRVKVSMSVTYPQAAGGAQFNDQKMAVTRTVPAGVSLDETDLNGAPGLVLRADGRPVVAILIDTDGERIQSVFAIANPDKLEALARQPAVQVVRPS